jgi:hypothetical protein
MYFDPKNPDTDGDGTVDGKEICLDYEVVAKNKAHFRVTFGGECSGSVGPR